MENVDNAPHAVSHLNQAVRHYENGKLLRLTFWSDGTVTWGYQPNPYTEQQG